MGGPGWLRYCGRVQKGWDTSFQVQQVDKGRGRDGQGAQGAQGAVTLTRRLQLVPVRWLRKWA